jgi:Cytochrome c oxidase subunit IV
MFEAWNALLQTLTQFVIPDWGGLIALLPIAIIALAVLTFALLFRGLLRAPRARRGFQPIKPATPEGIHMPGPSFAPVFAAIGAFLLFLGLVFGGMILVLGAIALTLTLLYWLAEAMRLYDREISASAPPLPAVIHDGPPPGVHMPGPSYRPFLGAIGVTMLMLGLVFGGWLLVIGVIALVATLVGWLVDAVKEYRKTVEADQTGHLENIPAPRTPTLMISTLAVLFIGGIILQTGIFPPRTADGSGAPSASGGPPPAGSAAPPPSGPPLPTGDVTIEAHGVAYVQTSFTGPVDTPFTIVFDNQDPGTSHDIDLKDAAGALVFDGKVILGVSNVVYDVGALPAGTYEFICSIHPIPAMTGTATLK